VPTVVPELAVPTLMQAGPMTMRRSCSNTMA
jgi:hypothetical protein